MFAALAKHEREKKQILETNDGKLGVTTKQKVI